MREDESRNPRQGREPERSSEPGERAPAAKRPADLPARKMTAEQAEEIRGGFKSETFPLEK